MISDSWLSRVMILGVDSRFAAAEVDRACSSTPQETPFSFRWPAPMVIPPVAGAITESERIAPNTSPRLRPTLLKLVPATGVDSPDSSPSANWTPRSCPSSSLISTMAASIITWARRTSRALTIISASCIIDGSPRTTSAFSPSSAKTEKLVLRPLPALPPAPPAPPEDSLATSPITPLRISVRFSASAWLRRMTLVVPPVAEGWSSFLISSLILSRKVSSPLRISRLLRSSAVTLYLRAALSPPPWPNSAGASSCSNSTMSPTQASSSWITSTSYLDGLSSSLTICSMRWILEEWSLTIRALAAATPARWPYLATSGRRMGTSSRALALSI